MDRGADAHSGAARRAWALALLVAACGGGAAPLEPAAPGTLEARGSGADGEGTGPEALPLVFGADVEDLERLAFVGPGSAPSEAFLATGFSAEVTRALLVDRFEVRRRDVLAAGVELASTREAGPDGWSAETLEWPAAFDHGEAEAFAGLRGMRLPTASEWVYLAVGRSGLRYPWGRLPQRSVANTSELGLGRLQAVGTFESGRAALGIYDLCGNSWEWVADRVPGLEPVQVVSAGDELVSVLGGSFLSRLRPTMQPGPGSGSAPVVFNALTLARGHRAVDLGARCVADAEAWLARHGAELTGSPERFEALGATWVHEGGDDVRALLERVLERAGDAPALAALSRGAARR